MFPKEAYPRIKKALVYTALLLAIFVVLTEPIVFTKYVYIYQAHLIFTAILSIIVLIRAFLHRRSNAGLALVGILVFGITIANDVLFYNEVWYTGDISQYGLLVFVIIQSMIISDRFTKAMHEVEHVSFKLRELNNTLETRIQDRTLELREMNADLEKTNHEMERMEESRRRLLTNISHDLRTPMTLIQGYLEALRDDIITDPMERKDYMQLMLRKITGLNHLISDVFELAKLEAGQVSIERKEIQIEELIEYIEDGYEFEVKNRGLNFYCTYPLEWTTCDRKLFLQVDLDRMFQVFNNLVYNAVKFTPIGGDIRIHFCYLEAEQSIRIEIADTGIGLSEEEITRVFERFYKKDYSRNSTGGGSGIGLTIAKEIIESHHGAIWVESELGQGCHFYITLPAFLR
jgi:signal transduction histidine kinase